MKWIMEHLTEAALLCTITIALIVIFGNITYTFPDGSRTTGFNAILGKSIDRGDKTYAAYQDDEVLQTNLSEDNPTIEYTDTGQAKLKSGSEIQLLEYFNIIYGNGNTYKASELAQVNVLDVLDPGKNSIISDYDPDQKTITFSTAGIYTIRLKVYDQDNRETTADLRIPVEEGY